MALIQLMAAFSLTTLCAIATVLLGGLLWATSALIGPLHIVWLTMIVYLLPLLSLLTDVTLPYRFASARVWNRRRGMTALGLGMLIGMTSLLVGLYGQWHAVDIVAVRTLVWLSISIVPLGLLVGGVSGRWSGANRRSHSIVVVCIAVVIGLQILTISDPWLRSVFELGSVSVLSLVAIAGGFFAMLGIRMVLEQAEQESLL